MTIHRNVPRTRRRNVHAISEVTVCAAGDAAGACGDGERNFQNLSTSGPDLAVIGELTNNVAILESQGQGFRCTFRWRLIALRDWQRSIAIASGDLNSDGVPTWR